MALEGLQDGDIRAVLALSRAEALAGTKRTFTLPEGGQIVIPVPAGIRDGQEIRLEGQGQPYLNGRKGALVLTIALEHIHNIDSQPDREAVFEKPAAFRHRPSLPVVPPHNDPSIGQSDALVHNFSQEPKTINAASILPAAAQYPPRHIEPPRQSRRGLSTGMIMLLTALAVIVVGGSVIILYATVIQPNHLRALTTATAVVKSTATALSQARGTAQAGATATVQTLAVAQTNATATVLQRIFSQATNGNPALNDSLNQQDNNNWEVDSKAGGGGCAFANGAYHVSIPLTGFFSSCYDQSHIFRNFVFQAQMTVLKGDRGGIIFRSDPTHTKFYLFRVGQDGSYDLYLYVDINGSNSQLLAQGSSSAIHMGLNRPNKIAVIAQGSNLSFYINQQFVVSIKDTSYQSGSIGVFADDQTNPTEVAFSNAKVWTL